MNFIWGIPVAWAQSQARTLDAFNFSSPITGITGCQAGSEFLPCYFSKLYLVMIEVAVAFAVLMILIGGLQWLMALGNQSKIGSARETISGAVIGLVLALISYVLFAQINTNLVDLKI